MKAALISLLAATLLGFASYAGGASLAATDFVAILFAAGLLAWTVQQYVRAPRTVGHSRPIRLPLAPLVRHSAGASAGRLAA
jgi:hypothetical protein